MKEFGETEFIKNMTTEEIINVFNNFGYEIHEQNMLLHNLMDAWNDVGGIESPASCVVLRDIKNYMEKKK